MIEMIYDDWQGIEKHQPLFDYIMGSGELPYYHKQGENIRGYFVHNVMDENEHDVPVIHSKLFFHFCTLIYDFCYQNNINIRGINRVAINVNVAEDDYDKIWTHVDSHKETLQLLFYLNDSDAETILYDKKWSEGMPLFDESVSHEVGRIQTKKNRVVVFDGQQYHSATNPTKGKRFIIVANIYYDK